MTARLTDDELEFLRNSDTYKSKPVRTREPKGKNRRPGFPRKTVIAILVIAVLILIMVVSALSDLKPYSDLSKSNTWTAISKMVDADEGLKDSAGQVETANQIYSLQGPIVTGIIVVTLILLAIIIGQWYLRLWAWEDKRKEHDRKNVIEDDQETSVHHGRNRHSGSGGHHRGHTRRTETVRREEWY